MQGNAERAPSGPGNFGRVSGLFAKIAKCGVRDILLRILCALMYCGPECPLPPLSVLLENPRINDTDSFVICVQMHCPVGPFYPHQPSASFVPKDLLDGLEALLDNASESYCAPLLEFF